MYILPLLYCRHAIIQLQLFMTSSTLNNLHSSQPLHGGSRLNNSNRSNSQNSTTKLLNSTADKFTKGKDQLKGGNRGSRTGNIQGGKHVSGIRHLSGDREEEFAGLWVGDENEIDGVGGGRDGGSIERRDGVVSSLYGVGKLLGAKLGKEVLRFVYYSRA